MKDVARRTRNFLGHWAAITGILIYGTMILFMVVGVLVPGLLWLVGFPLKDEINPYHTLPRLSSVESLPDNTRRTATIAYLVLSMGGLGAYRVLKSRRQ